MTGRMTLSVYDDVHSHIADKLEFDLCRVTNNGTHRDIIKHGTIDKNQNQVLLLTADKAEALGSYEIVLFIKDYYGRLDENLPVPDSRLVLPFGVSRINEDNHLNVHYTN